ncbi:MAG: AMP-binding protein [Opitutales bacterium]|jgi:acyl-[acyl-carrier-protein]-phospholipid O-acyltransferase/long-chain-fatty-acid--[acyl-carrier-protein] ligase
MAAPDPFVVDCQYEQFAQRPELQGHIASLAFKSLARKPFEPLIVDLSSGRREMKAGIFLAVAIALSRRLRKIPNRRIGVVLPSGIASSLSNLAISLADKVPVNLNFTSGRKAIESSIRKAALTHIVTARPMMAKLQDFPWTEDLVDFVDLFKSIRKTEILGWLGAILTTPSSLLMRWLDVPQNGGDREAALLFSSGSTGEPKGVVLTHRNIIGNCLQIAGTHMLDTGETILANLPTFHSFGFTVNLWYTLLSVVKTVCLPNPLETRRCAQAVYDEKVTVMIGTPTLFRPYFKKVEPELLKSLKFTVAGAEKTPDGFAEMWKSHFGCNFVIGYGLTETSPVVAADVDYARGISPNGFTGSTGKLLPGLQARIVDDTTGEVIEPTRCGVLHVRGVNVFRGYLGDIESTNRAFDGDWFKTGDLARFDEDNNLFIEGRISRFSKIGGEMVPHGTVEQAVVQAFHLEESEVPMVAVTGARDDAKGESLVLFTAMDIDAATLRERLIAQAIPNLWIPRRIRRVDAIPCLASGKLDLRTLRDAAQQSVDAEEEAV